MRRRGKAAAYYDSVRDERAEWASAFTECMGCGGHGDFRGLQIHEICRRSHASKRWAHPSTYLLLCAGCHEGVFATAPHAMQLAVKKLRDPSCYSLDDWRKIDDPDGRAPMRVTEQEVQQWVRVLQGLNPCSF